MALRNVSPVRPAFVVGALLAATGLGIWSAERAVEALGIGARTRSGSSAAGRLAATRAPRSAPPVETVPLPYPEATVTPPTAPARQDAGEAVAPEEAAAAVGLVSDLGRFFRDLEWTPGLPEPRQQTVVPAPEPWRTPQGPAAPAPVIEGIEPASVAAAGGAQVTLRGEHLRPASVVFGHAPARIVSASPRAIVVVAPGGSAGPVSIAVTNDDGTFAIAEQRLTYEAPGR